MKRLILCFLLITSPTFAADISNEYRYQVLVKETVKGIQYSDAIYYTPTQWESLKQADVNAEIKKRTDNYKYALENPAPVIEPTVEQLESEKANLLSQVSDLDARISAKSKLIEVIE